MAAINIDVSVGITLSTSAEKGTSRLLMTTGTITITMTTTVPVGGSSIGSGGRRKRSSICCHLSFVALSVHIQTERCQSVFGFSLIRNQLLSHDLTGGSIHDSKILSVKPIHSLTQQ
jgi:hypothetical protein